jgi:cytoskeletal protein RodZ
MPPQYPMPPQQPSRQPNFFRRKAGCLPMWAILLIIAIFACVGASAIANSGNTTTTTTNTSDNGAQVTATNSAQLAATNSAQGTTDTPVPTATLDTSIPTSTPAPTSGQTESAYKKSTTSTTVDNLDKNGNADKGKDVHFTCKILKFVKDDNGNTAGANVESPDTYSSSILQIVFPSGTDITRLNEGDTVEVWGTDAGVFSGQNAFGGTVQEVGIAALYLTDKTTNYQTH